MNTNDIVTRLQNGENMETIAAEITNMLNEAQLEYDRQCAKNTRDSVIRSAAAALVDSLLDYLNVAMPGCLEEVEESDIDELINTVAELAEDLPEIFALLELSLKPKKVLAKKTPTDNKKSADDVIATFLKTNFLA